MVFQPKVFCAFGAALSLYNAVGVQAHWMGAMEAPADIFKRQLTCTDVGFVPCGNRGCVDETLCCNQDAGWLCAEGNACYTVSGTVDCYSASFVRPTTARSCYDYTQTGCETGCFGCTFTSWPFCSTEVLAGATQIWIDCGAEATVVTVGSETTRTVATSASARPGSGSSTRSFDVSITPGPDGSTATASTSDSGSGGLSGGAIAGIAIGAFAVIAIIGALVFFLMRKSRNDAQPQHVAEVTEYQPPLPPGSPLYNQNIPQYQPVGQSMGSPVSSYQDPPKGHYAPHSPPPPGVHAQGVMQTGPAELPHGNHNVQPMQPMQQNGPAELS